MGIDPGISHTGFGLVEVDERGRLEYLTCGSISTPSKAPFVDRLLKIHLQLHRLFQEFGPQELAIEQVFFARNARSALVLGQARGAALLSAALAGIPVFEYAATAAKMAVCGYGGAEKRQVGAMVKALLGLADDVTEHAADALALCICHSHSTRALAGECRGSRGIPLPSRARPRGIKSRTGGGRP